MMIRGADAIAEARRVADLAGSADVHPDWAPVADRIRDEATDDWDDTVAVERLEKAGVISGYRALIDPAALGMALTAFISITPIDVAHPDNYPDLLAEIREIESCWSVAGEESYILKVRTTTPAALEDLAALDVLAPQVVPPGLQLLRRVHGQREVVRRPPADDPLGQVGVLHQAEQPPRRAVDGAEPHVPDARVVVADAVAHDAQPEHVPVEGDGPLHVGADQGQVVQPGQLHAARLAHRGPERTERVRP